MSLIFEDIVFRAGDTTLSLNEKLEGKITALFGPSGAGKTTLLELIAGLKRPQKGRILMHDIVLTGVAQRINIRTRHRAIGYVPQDLALFPHLAVRKNIGYGKRSANETSPSVSQEKLCELLEIESLLDRMPATLSGGEKQRVALARALLSAPRLLLLDEPLSSLDQELRNRVTPYLERIRDELQIPMIYVTHAASEIVAFCDDVLVLQAGRCTAHGEPRKLFLAEPAASYRLKEPSDTLRR